MTPGTKPPLENIGRAKNNNATVWPALTCQVSREHLTPGLAHCFPPVSSPPAGRHRRSAAAPRTAAPARQAPGRRGWAAPRPGSPEDVGAGGRAPVDVLRQPPLHRHVPVPHAIAHAHAEVRAVAVDVADGLIVVLQGSRLLRTGGWRVRVGDRHAAQPGPSRSRYCPSPGR